MKIINVWGEASGRLGGFVFSRNKGGAYIRKHVTPINPNSQKQRAVRERFSQRALEFRALPQEIKAMWQEYIQTYYSPLTGSGRGSALNGFVSCRQAVDNANVAAQNTTFNVTATPSQPFSLPTIPPDRPLAANILINDRLVIPEIKSVIYTNGNLSVKIQFPETMAVDNIEFKNENNVRISMNLYISSPSGGSYFSNPYRSLIGSTAGYRFESIPDGTISLSGAITLQARYNYRCTLVLMDEFGQQLPISTYDFTVPANP